MEMYHSDVIGCFIWELQKTSSRRNNGTSWIRTLRRLGGVPLRCRLVFHSRLIWDVVGTYWWDVVITCPWDLVTLYQQVVVKTYHWDAVGCFIWDVAATLLGRTERCHYDVATTSCCRVGWNISQQKLKEHYDLWESSKKCFS